MRLISRYVKEIKQPKGGIVLGDEENIGTAVDYYFPRWMQI